MIAAFEQMMKMMMMQKHCELELHFHTVLREKPEQQNSTRQSFANFRLACQNARLKTQNIVQRPVEVDPTLFALGYNRHRRP
jgi:hypothetical protein